VSVSGTISSNQTVSLLRVIYFFQIPNSLLADHLSSAYLLFYQRNTPVIITDLKTERAPPSSTCSFALTLYANSKTNYFSASSNQEARLSKVASNKTQNQKRLQTRNRPSGKLFLDDEKKKMQKCLYILC
jgi:hypothetical protein